jgi:curli biogenesis system outer membrane secretion channel CsgG
MYFLKVTFAVALVSLLTACSTTTKVQYLEPAEIPMAATLKQIAVNDFDYDSVGLAGRVETKLHETVLNHQPYFTVVSRQHIEQLIAEQKLQYSGLTPEQKSVQLGELIGAQAFVMGEVTSKGYQDKWFTEERSECADKKCKELRKYHVSCKSRTFTLSAHIKMIAVETSQIIYSGDLSRSGDWSTCSDRNYQLPLAIEVWQSYADSIAEEFVGKISPKYVYKQIKLLEEPDIPYTAVQQSNLEQGIEFVEANRLDKAEALFSQLVFETQSNSYTANYNLGVVKEAQGEYQEAKRLYVLADRLQKQPVDEINQALIRIDAAIANHLQAMKQIEH